MLVEERRAHILQIVEEKGFVTLQQLADCLDTSESTVRRDLEYLDGMGQLRRTRGGATYVGETLPSLEERGAKALKEKRAIARFLAKLIEPEETILLDGGTTTLEIARHLTDKSIQVVTNSLPIANLLASSPSVELIFLGGYLYPKTGVALGPFTVSALESIHARRLIMSSGGVTERGLFNSNALLVEAERRMMQACQEVILACDSSKFGQLALCHLCELDAVDRLVTDDGIPEAWKQVIQSAGVRLDVVSPTGASTAP